MAGQLSLLYLKSFGFNYLLVTLTGQWGAMGSMCIIIAGLIDMFTGQSG